LKNLSGDLLRLLDAGVVVLALDGKLSGGDTVMSYTGCCRSDGEQFEATLFTSRYSLVSPWGIDDPI